MAQEFRQSKDEMVEAIKKHPLANPGGLDQSLNKINQMESSWELITPETARVYLDNYNKKNRNKKPKSLLAYASDMRSESWQINPEPIVFLENKILGNGQNRLEAVIESNTSCFMYVFRNAPVEVMKVLDTGVPRSAPDTLKIGFDMEDVTQTQVGMARQMIYGIRKSLRRKPTPADLAVFIKRHKQAIHFASTGAPIGFRQAGWQGALARAYYHAEQPILERFKGILFNGGSNAEDSAANALKSYIAVHKKKFSGQSAKAELYALTETCLHHFINREPLTIKSYSKISKHVTDKELFPVPDEEKDLGDLYFDWNLAE